MEAGRQPSAVPSKREFNVCRNPALAAAASRGQRATKPSFLPVALVTGYAVSLLALGYGEEALAGWLARVMPFFPAASHYTIRFVQVLFAILLVAALADFVRMLSLLWPGDGKRSQFTGIEAAKKPPDSKPSPAKEPLKPLRKSYFHQTSLQLSRTRSSLIGPTRENTVPTSLLAPTSTPIRSNLTPRLRKSPASSSAGAIQTLGSLQKFLENAAEEYDNVAEFFSKAVTPPSASAVRSIGLISPVSPAVSPALSGATPRNTPLRPVRMSPGSFHASPPKGDKELPPPMSLQQATEGFDSLGIYPQIEEWRDRLRQWFASAVLNPLVEKISCSHLRVIQAAASIGVSITVSEIGSEVPGTTTLVSSLSPISGIRGWQPTATLDEDAILHQLLLELLRHRDAPPSQPSFGQHQQQNPPLSAMQACIDAITEYESLNALIKGELIKGLLPHGSTPAAYTVQRIRELAEGTCLTNYDYLGKGDDGKDNASKKWGGELLCDSHLLFYLFAAFLEYPKWMLHVDAASYWSPQSCNNPLFLGVLPPKESFPDKYVALISGAPAVLHPGACVLAVGKQNPPIFSLYWDKKLQFSLQGRTALWDAILLLVHRIEMNYGSVVRGIHLNSSALNLLSIISSETESQG